MVIDGFAGMSFREITSITTSGVQSKSVSESWLMSNRRNLEQPRR